MAHVRWGAPWACNDERVSRDHSDLALLKHGVCVELSVMDVVSECMFQVEHDLF